MGRQRAVLGWDHRHWGWPCIVPVKLEDSGAAGSASSKPDQAMLLLHAPSMAASRLGGIAPSLRQCVCQMIHI